MDFVEIHLSLSLLKVTIVIHRAFAILKLCSYWSNNKKFSIACCRYFRIIYYISNK